MQSHYAHAGGIVGIGQRERITYYIRMMNATWGQVAATYSLGRIISNRVLTST